MLLPEQEEEEYKIINRKLFINITKSLLYFFVGKYFMIYLLNILTF